ncbi:hypothetical protein SCHPADRAFT_896418 [Schizopora paradoxa]|uniref:Uncharacterized protein n=1 Tax=Schizopora paradoxa TaxID=27342 RepID=A0A0H2R0E0_9AGAM|nr:hypothetical protein SCHPADRAFT_896418 [Schizopora paradoxa]
MLSRVSSSRRTGAVRRFGKRKSQRKRLRLRHASNTPAQLPNGQGASTYADRLNEENVCVFLAEDKSIAGYLLEQLFRRAEVVSIVIHVDGDRCTAIQMACGSDIYSFWLDNIACASGTLPTLLKDILESHYIVKASNEMRYIANFLYTAYGVEMVTCIDTSLFAACAFPDVTWDIDSETGEITLEELTGQLTGLELEAIQSDWDSTPTAAATNGAACHALANLDVPIACRLPPQRCYDNGLAATGYWRIAVKAKELKRGKEDQRLRLVVGTKCVSKIRTASRLRTPRWPCFADGCKHRAAQTEELVNHRVTAHPNHAIVCVSESLMLAFEEEIVLRSLHGEGLCTLFSDRGVVIPPSVNAKDLCGSDATDFHWLQDFGIAFPENTDVINVRGDAEQFPDEGEDEDEYFDEEKAYGDWLEDDGLCPVRVITTVKNTQTPDCYVFVRRDECFNFDCPVKNCEFIATSGELLWDHTLPAHKDSLVIHIKPNVGIAFPNLMSTKYLFIMDAPEAAHRDKRSFEDLLAKEKSFAFAFDFVWSPGHGSMGIAGAVEDIRTNIDLFAEDDDIEGLTEFLKEVGSNLVLGGVWTRRCEKESEDIAMLLWEAYMAYKLPTLFFFFEFFRTAKAPSRCTGKDRLDELRMRASISVKNAGGEVDGWQVVADVDTNKADLFFKETATAPNDGLPEDGESTSPSRKDRKLGVSRRPSTPRKPPTSTSQRHITPAKESESYGDPTSQHPTGSRRDSNQLQSKDRKMESEESDVNESEDRTALDAKHVQQKPPNKSSQAQNKHAEDTSSSDSDIQYIDKTAGKTSATFRPKTRRLTSVKRDVPCDRCVKFNEGRCIGIKGAVPMGLIEPGFIKAEPGTETVLTVSRSKRDREDGLDESDASKTPSKRVKWDDEPNTYSDEVGNNTVEQNSGQLSSPHEPYVVSSGEEEGEESESQPEESEEESDENYEAIDLDRHIVQAVDDLQIENTERPADDTTVPPNYDGGQGQGQSNKFLQLAESCSDGLDDMAISPQPERSPSDTPPIETIPEQKQNTERTETREVDDGPKATVDEETPTMPSADPFPRAQTGRLALPEEAQVQISKSS